VIPPVLLAAPAIALLGLTTRRQADLLFRPLLRTEQRRRLQGIGWLLLVLSLSVALISGDTGRRFIEWVCTVGIFALLAALSFTALIARRDGRRGR